MFENFFVLDNPLFWDILQRFLIDVFFLILLIRVVYLRFSNKPNYVFSFSLMGVVIFFIGSMLPIVFTSGMTQLGMAIGLFAIFTILKFRTVNLSIKDMAYIFTVIAISAVNSLKWEGFPTLGIFIFNIIIILTALTLEILLARYIKSHPEINKKKLITHPIVYNNMELLKPQNKAELTKDIIEITGLNIKKIEIKQVDYQNMNALLDIFY
jgi:hypothetical protein